MRKCQISLNQNISSRKSNLNPNTFIQHKKHWKMDMMFVIAADIIRRGSESEWVMIDGDAWSSSITLLLFYSLLLFYFFLFFPLLSFFFSLTQSFSNSRLFSLNSTLWHLSMSEPKMINYLSLLLNPTNRLL